MPSPTNLIIYLPVSDFQQMATFLDQSLCRLMTLEKLLARGDGLIPLIRTAAFLARSVSIVKLPSFTFHVTRLADSVTAVVGLAAVVQYMYYVTLPVVGQQLVGSSRSRTHSSCWTALNKLIKAYFTSVRCLLEVHRDMVCTMFHGGLFGF